MWFNPIPYELSETADSNSWQFLPDSVTGLPVGDHPGSFGFVRKNHLHEGIDLYCPEGTPVRAVEDGVVVAVEKFTGASATPSSPWWHDTEAALVEGNSGVVLYGEITCIRQVGDVVKAGQLLGYVIQVLKKDKGRPMSMLHLELHTTGTICSQEWTIEGGKPNTLIDPTSHLLPLCG
jgi:murein DD-endopeptidase MepM/ murein hydrolase activator NlpD